MVPMALPVFGGMLFAIVTIFVVPIAYAWYKELTILGDASGIPLKAEDMTNRYLKEISPKVSDKIINLETSLKRLIRKLIKK